MFRIISKIANGCGYADKLMLKNINDNDLPYLRERTRILFVDDEKLDLIDVLRARKYDVYYKNDISYAIEAAAFDFIFIDIIGVGSALGSSMEGLAIAIEIKKMYPEKLVYCYSAKTNSREVTEKIREIDGYFLKDTGPDQWCEKLDGLIHKYYSCEYQLDVLSKRLKDGKMSEKDIDRVVKAYKKGWEKKDFTDAINKLSLILKDAKIIVDIISMIYTFVGHYTR